MSANKGVGIKPPPKEPVIGFFGLLSSILCPTIIGLVIVAYLEESSYLSSIYYTSWYPTKDIAQPLFSGSYILIGAASYLIGKVGTGSCGLVLPQLFYVIQLLASYAWFILFFRQNSFELGLAASSVQWVAALVTVILFGKVVKKSLILTLPYLLWHLLVLALNIQLYVEYRLT